MFMADWLLYYCRTQRGPMDFIVYTTPYGVYFHYVKMSLPMNGRLREHT